jgi:exosortase/archaeosortase family protein
MPWIYNIIPQVDYNHTVRPSDGMFFFMLILPCFSEHIAGLSIREKVSIRNLAVFFLFTAFFAAFLNRVINVYPFQPMSEANPFIKFAHIFNKEVGNFTMRFRISYFFIAVACHFALISAFFKTKKTVIDKYLYSACIGFFLAELPDMFMFLKTFFIVNIARAESIMLGSSGFLPVLQIAPGELPVVGTDRYLVTIAHYCSGLNGISLFLLVFSMMVFRAGEKLRKARVLVVMALGVLFMAVMNALRIYVIILLGHFVNAETAHSFHTYGGIAIYIIAIMLIYRETYAWITEPPVVRGKLSAAG